MTLDEARLILALEERARLAIATAGEIPADWVARHFAISRGAALSLIIAARRFEAAYSLYGLGAPVATQVHRG